MIRVGIAFAALLLAAGMACAVPDMPAMFETKAQEVEAEPYMSPMGVTAPTAAVEQDGPPIAIAGLEVGLRTLFDDAEDLGSEMVFMLPLYIEALAVDPPPLTLENLPRYLIAHTNLELIFPSTLDDVDLGLSVRALTLNAQIPIRVGINRMDGEWGWHVSGAILQF